MTPEQQRIAIAEACGEDNDSIYRDLIPNYLNDLNAMHEAEGMLGDKWMPYARLLLEITTGCGPAMPLGFLNAATLCSAVHATAAQRAEAFLRTIGKWEEAK
jgi:hypothetical protein